MTFTRHLVRATVRFVLVALVSLIVGLLVEGTADAGPTAPTGTTQRDAASEGTDVLPVAFHDAPPELWNALRDQMPGAYDDDVPGIGTFWFPMGGTVDFHGADGSGLFLATYDGIMVCIDHETFAGECSATGPVQPTSIRTRTATSVYDYRTWGTSADCGSDGQCAAFEQDHQLAALGTMTDGAVQDAPQIVTVAYSEPLTADYPRRSPGGARVLPRSQWLDNSPLYRDGYVWLVDDTAHTTSWRKLTEDGSLVSPDFYRHTTTTGATQARCDYLGKRRVPDATYGHRCV